MQLPSPLQALPCPADGPRLLIKRDDLIHPVVSGNKWRKLGLLLPDLQQKGYAGVISFGGPFSNHLYALAAAGPMHGLQTAAIIRGTQADAENHTLAYARAQGMRLYAVSKAAYNQGLEAPEVQAVLKKYPDWFVLPEGGAGPWAVEGCTLLAEEIMAQLQAMACPENTPVYIAVAAGSGATAAGLLRGLATYPQARLLVFPAARYGVSVESIQKMAGITAYLHWETRFTGARFANPDPAIRAYALDFQEQTGIALDPIYTCRVLYGLSVLLDEGFFEQHAWVVAVHSGGLRHTL